MRPSRLVSNYNQSRHLFLSSNFCAVPSTPRTSNPLGTTHNPSHRRLFSHFSHLPSQNMSSTTPPSTSTPRSPPNEILFSSFPVAHQVFHTSPSGLSHALNNLRPLLPGHTLVIPHRTSARHLEDLSEEERADILATVVRMQKVLRRVYSSPDTGEIGGGGGGDDGTAGEEDGKGEGQGVAIEGQDGREAEERGVGNDGQEAGRLRRRQARRPAGKVTAFNVAIQDGVAAGQTVPHLHIHVIPRRDRDLDAYGGGDVLYEWLESEEGDLDKQYKAAGEEGGDAQDGTGVNGDATGVEMHEKGKIDNEEKASRRRTGSFTPEAHRKNRSKADMHAEAAWLAQEMAKEEELEGKRSSLRA
ncbi:MAG: hypothetical protein Q9165_006279 [Trypethelium subeluteriae]